MSRELGGTTPLTRLRRLPEKGAYDAATIHAIVDATSVCHVATVIEGQPIVLPSLHVRDGDTLLLHGSRSSRLLRAMVAAESVCIAVTVVDGLVVARSTLTSARRRWTNSSMGCCLVARPRCAPRRLTSFGARR